MHQRSTQECGHQSRRRKGQVPRPCHTSWHGCRVTPLLIVAQIWNTTSEDRRIQDTPARIWAEGSVQGTESERVATELAEMEEGVLWSGCVVRVSFVSTDVFFCCYSFLSFQPHNGIIWEEERALKCSASCMQHSASQIGTCTTRKIEALGLPSNPTDPGWSVGPPWFIEATPITPVTLSGSHRSFS